MKKCLYCGREIPEESVVDFCEHCGVSVFGEKMFKAIISNMEDARERNDLVHRKDFGIENEEIEKKPEI